MSATRCGRAVAGRDGPGRPGRACAALEASMARAGRAGRRTCRCRAQRGDAQARSAGGHQRARYVELGEQNFISPSAVEAKQQEQASADARVASAEANWRPRGRSSQRLGPSRAACAAARQRAPAGDPPMRGHQPRRRARLHRGGGQAVLRLIEPSSCGSGAAGPGPLGRAGRRPAGADRAALEAGQQRCRQGGSASSAPATA
jgi:HlyD family secretion protein